jgi:DNA-binding response OmpR family regulator
MRSPTNFGYIPRPPETGFYLGRYFSAYFLAVMAAIRVQPPGERRSVDISRSYLVRMPKCVLVVEDERKLRGLLRAYLERAGFAVYTTGSGAEAIGLASEQRVDLVVLDLGLPDVPGDEVLREVRAVCNVPILVLTARAAEEDRIHGLELGADDYLTKPFSPRELVLRTQAIVRRCRDDGVSHGPLSFGDDELWIEDASRRVCVRGEEVSLTPTEWSILLALAGAPGRVFSRFELINRARGHEFEGYERTIDSHIKNLRRKVERDPHLPLIVETVLGGGYRLGLRRDG